MVGFSKKIMFFLIIIFLSNQVQAGRLKVLTDFLDKVLKKQVVNLSDPTQLLKYLDEAVKVRTSKLQDNLYKKAFKDVTGNSPAKGPLSAADKKKVSKRELCVTIAATLSNRVDYADEGVKNVTIAEVNGRRTAKFKNRNKYPDADSILNTALDNYLGARAASNLIDKFDCLRFLEPREINEVDFKLGILENSTIHKLGALFY